MYALQNTFVPQGTTNRKGVIELVLAQNHYCLLLRWRDINETPPPVEAPEPRELISKCAPIVKRKRDLIQPYDQKIAVYDLECTGNGTDDKVHRCYAVGVAWMTHGAYQYERFGTRTLNAIQQFFISSSAKETFAKYLLRS